MNFMVLYMCTMVETLVKNVLLRNNYDVEGFPRLNYPKNI